MRLTACRLAGGGLRGRHHRGGHVRDTALWPGSATCPAARISVPVAVTVNRGLSFPRPVLRGLAGAGLDPGSLVTPVCAPPWPQRLPHSHRARAGGLRGRQRPGMPDWGVLL